MRRASRTHAISIRAICAVEYSRDSVEDVTKQVGRIIALSRPASFALVAALLVGACASGPQLPAPQYLAKDAAPAAAAAGEPQETPDPLEAMNRKIFETNQAFNHAIIYPAAKSYRDNVPESVRDRIDAFTTNLAEPMVFANNVLQLRPDAALTTLARFLTNSTIGIGGLFDVAETVGQKHQSGDFGQTLYVWGARDTAYLILPVLGPSNVRDTIGSGIELLAPAATIERLPTKLANFVDQFKTLDTYGRPVAGLSKVEMLEELEESSLDFYAMLRSLADQKRQSELKEALDQSLLGGGGSFGAPVLEATNLEPGPAQLPSTPAKFETTPKRTTTVTIGAPEVVSRN